MMPAGHAVVGGVDALEAALAERVDGGTHLLVRLVRRPVRDVLLVDDLLDLGVQDAVRALLEEGSVRVERRAVDHDDIAVLGLVAQRLDQGLALQTADLLVVVRDVRGDRALGEPVVRDDLDALLVGLLDPGLRGLVVDRVQHDDLDTLRDQGVELLLLGLRVPACVVVLDFAVGAEGLDLRLDERAVEGLVTRGLVLRQQQTDGLAVTTAAAVLVVARLATSGEGDGHRNCGRAYDDASRHCVHCGCASLTRPQRCGRGGLESTRPQAWRQGVNS